ncbi:MAG: hypothetical protein IPN23_10895 [Elusimicrobia bacterium]|nr:hypothetical protein [Elusimicrobiota bacterium]
MNFDEFIAALKARRPEWFAANAQNRPQEPAAVKKAPEVVKMENVPQTTPKPPAQDAVVDGWDGDEVVDADEPDNWWDK